MAVGRCALDLPSCRPIFAAMAAPPDSVKRLVDRFDLGRKVFESGDYKEEQLRLEFLNPFFAALGCDMDNKQGLSEAANDR